MSKPKLISVGRCSRYYATFHDAGLLGALLGRPPASGQRAALDLASGVNKGLYPDVE